MAPFDISLAHIDSLIASLTVVATPAPAAPSAPAVVAPAKAEKGGKPKAAKPAKKNAPATIWDSWALSNVVVARIASVSDHPVADSLYALTLDVGAEEPIVFAAGLKNFYTPSELLDRRVVAILNLKPAKLAGSLSYAMLFAGSAPLPDGEGEKVVVLDPPAAAAIGARVVPEGHEADCAETEPAATLSSKHHKKIVSALKVVDGCATLDGACLCVPDCGRVACEGLPDGAEIH
jgi:methionine--tRNA ligase beta chain